MNEHTQSSNITLSFFDTLLTFFFGNITVRAVFSLGRAHSSQQAQEDCDSCGQGLVPHEARARDVAEIAQGRQRTNHLRLGRRGRARGGGGGGGGGGAIRHKRTMDKFLALRSCRSRVSIGRRADVEPPVPGCVIRMERGRWRSSCLTLLRAWPRPS